MAIDRALQHNREAQPNNNEERPNMGHINTIRGGSIFEKESNNIKKVYAREVYNLYKQPTKKFKVDPTISFPDEDYVRFIAPHEDALVITDSIVDYTVSKILVNNGRSMDILHHHALSGMDLQRIQIEPCKEGPYMDSGTNKLIS